MALRIDLFRDPLQLREPTPDTINDTLLCLKTVAVDLAVEGNRGKDPQPNIRQRSESCGRVRDRIEQAGGFRIPQKDLWCPGPMGAPRD